MFAVVLISASGVKLVQQAVTDIFSRPMLIISITFFLVGLYNPMQI